MDSDTAITSEEETSNDEEQIVDQESELESDDDKVDQNEADEIGLDASGTDSDEDDSDIDDNLEDNKQKEIKSKSGKVKEQVIQRYQERQGKQLYFRFPHKVPETQEALDQKVREFAPLAVKAHKPRQRHVRFCLIDFASKEDRDAAYNKLKKSIKNGELKKFAVDIPRTERSDFVQELAERKVKSLENKKAKLRLKRATKKALKENNFTSTIVVLNLPKNASALQIRQLFANAVDINIKPCKGKLNSNTSIAAVTFPTTLDARNAIKKKLSLGGNQLIIKFDNKKWTKKTKTLNVSKKEEGSQQSVSPAKQSNLEITLGKVSAKATTTKKTKALNVSKKEEICQQSVSPAKQPNLQITLGKVSAKATTTKKTKPSTSKSDNISVKKKAKLETK